jgi:MtfA peptidase
MLIFILSVTAIIIYLNYSKNKNVRQAMAFADTKAAPFKTKVFPIPRRYRQILLKYFPFYGKLSKENRKVFERKLVKFLYSKRFIPRGVPEVTIEAKVLISASAVQLTFGLPDIHLAHFSKILVYPNDYYSSITRRYHKGEVNPLHGIIVLSWQSFIDGYINNQDSFNLGLHEMAHALRLENIIRNEEYNFFNNDLLDDLDKFAYDFCNGPETEQSHFLRPYACTNVHEFFSVAVENFFERPRAFKENLPGLYTILSRLLNQDPVHLTNS